MKYLLLICAVESETVGPHQHLDHPPPDPETEDWVREMDARGIRTFGTALRATSTATTIRVRDGETLVSDGPFTETKEQILGFDLIECEDLEEAIAVVSRHPVARYGTIEVRPLWPS
ncbi:YciI family protein [Actinomadura fulvescens]|uniref:YciI family protein n=1 Tax=Actinomadura fulvescens TaxID=46160 RepID=A0ABP6C066_9ACTN